MLEDGSTSHADPAAARRIPEGRDYLGLTELAQLTPAELTRRTTALAPLVAAKALDAERSRRPDMEVWSAIRASGFFYQFVPKSFGGLSVSTDDFVDAALPIAQACPSTGWTACFCAGHNRTLAHFPAETQAELWGGRFPYIVAPMLGAPPGQAVRVDGGYSITGLWSWGSGIMDADWAFAAALVTDGEEPPRMLLVLFPAGEAEVVDTWHVDGLEGSGSNDVMLKDLFVPERRTLGDMNILSGQTHEGYRHAEPIFQAPMISFAGFIASVPILGAAKGALTRFQERLTERVEKGTNAKSADSAIKHVRLAEADLMIATAEKLIRDGGRQVVVAGALAGNEQVRLRIMIRAQLTYAAKLCRDAVLQLAEAAGSNAHRLSDPFQRHVRAIGIMTSHAAFDVDQAYELQGRALLDLEPQSMMF